MSLQNIEEYDRIGEEKNMEFAGSSCRSKRNRSVTLKFKTKHSHSKFRVKKHYEVNSLSSEFTSMCLGFSFFADTK